MKNEKIADPWRSPQYAAEYLGVSTETVRRLIQRGILPVSRIKSTKLLRIRQSELDALMQRIPTANWL